MLFRLINIHKTSILNKKYRIIFYVSIILCMLVIYNFINNMYFKNINNFNLYIDIQFYDLLIKIGLIFNFILCFLLIDFKLKNSYITNLILIYNRFKVIISLILFYIIEIILTNLFLIINILIIFKLLNININFI